MSPCEAWAETDKAGYYAQFSLQAYEFASATNRVDLIRLGPYCLDLDVNGGTLLKLPANDLEPPPKGLSGSWNPAKGDLMIQRMLGEVPLVLSPGPQAGGEQEPEDLSGLGASAVVPALQAPAPPGGLDPPPRRQASRSAER